jgi:hypothetical protein
MFRGEAAAGAERSHAGVADSREDGHDQADQDQRETEATVGATRWLAPLPGVGGVEARQWERRVLPGRCHLHRVAAEASRRHRPRG